MRTIGIVALISVVCRITFAGTTDIPIMTLEEIKSEFEYNKDFKVFGRTVFKGETPQDFYGTVSGLIDFPDGMLGSMPLAIAELTGGPAVYKLEDNGVAAGMSGSPLLKLTTDGYKVIGGIKATPLFGKRANAEVQLAETMIRGAQELENRKVQVSDGFSFPQQTLLVGLSGPFPLSDEISGLFRQRNLQVSSGLSSPGNINLELEKTELEGGSSIIAYLAMGDLALGVNGTVSMVYGNSFYAFAHEIFATGYTSLPITKARVIKTIPSYYLSYKEVRRSTGVIGTIDLDGTWGVKGTLGKQPRLIPVSYSIKDRAVQEEYNTWVADVYGLKEWIIQTFTYYVLQGGYRKFDMGRRDGNGSAQINLKIETNEFPYIFELPPYVLTYDRGTVFTKFSNYQKGLLPRVFDILFKNGFTFRSVSFDIEYFAEQRLLELKTVELDTNKAAPGDTIILTMIFHSENNELKRYETSIPFVVPLSVGAGDIEVSIKTGDLLNLKGNTQPSVDKALKTVPLYNNTHIYVTVDMNNLDSFDKERIVQEGTTIVDDSRWDVSHLESRTIFKYIRPPLDGMAIDANKTVKFNVSAREELEKEKEQQEKQKVDQQLNQFKIKE